MSQNVTTNIPFPANSNVVGYIRDSGGAKQELSVLQQKEVILRWADDAGVNVVRFFVDEARSGASTAKREAFLEMMDWLDNGQNVAAVVVWSLSRFSRDYNDAQLYLARIRSKGYQIYSLEENIPPGTVGRIVESLHLLMAETYRIELSANVRRGMMYVVKAYHAWARPIVPIGYRKKPIDAGVHRDGSSRVLHALEPDPATAPLVLQAFQMRKSGATIKEIRDATGLYKNLDSYSRLWRNKIYIGVAEYGGETIERFCEPIVDLDTWNAVQEINAHFTQKRRYGFYHPRSVSSPGMLSGLVYCKSCGSVMRIASARRLSNGKTELWRYYQCRGYHHGNRCNSRMIPAAYLENAVLDAIKDHLLSPSLLLDAYNLYKEKYKERATQHRAKLNAVQDEIKRIDRRIANLSIAIAETGHTRSLLAQLTEQENERDRLAEQLRQISSTADVIEFRDLTEDELIEVGKQVWNEIKNGDPRTKQRLIRSVVERIDVVRVDGGRSIANIKLDGEIKINPVFML